MANTVRITAGIARAGQHSTRVCRRMRTRVCEIEKPGDSCGRRTNAPDARPEAFDHADWIFELKHDGFRAGARPGAPLRTHLAQRPCLPLLAAAGGRNSGT